MCTKTILQQLASSRVDKYFHEIFNYLAQEISEEKWHKKISAHILCCANFLNFEWRGSTKTVQIREMLCKKNEKCTEKWHNTSLCEHSSACPICYRFWSQEHMLRDCPSTTEAQLGGSLDLNITVSVLPPGPMLELGRQFQLLLSTFNQPTLLARRWARQWDQAAISSFQPALAPRTSKQIKAVQDISFGLLAPPRQHAGGTSQRWQKTSHLPSTSTIHRHIRLLES